MACCTFPCSPLSILLVSTHFSMLPTLGLSCGLSSVASNICVTGSRYICHSVRLTLHLAFLLFSLCAAFCVLCASLISMSLYLYISSAPTCRSARRRARLPVVLCLMTVNIIRIQFRLSHLFCLLHPHGAMQVSHSASRSLNRSCMSVMTVTNVLLYCLS